MELIVPLTSSSPGATFCIYWQPETSPRLLVQHSALPQYPTHTHTRTHKLVAANEITAPFWDAGHLTSLSWSLFFFPLWFAQEAQTRRLSRQKEPYLSCCWPTLSPPLGAGAAEHVSLEDSREIWQRERDGGGSAGLQQVSDPPVDRLCHQHFCWGTLWQKFSARVTSRLLRRSSLSRDLTANGGKSEE